MKKIISLLLVVVCCFSFVGMVNAEEKWSTLTEDVTFIDDLATGKSLKDNTAAKNVFSKYKVYYKYIKIDDATFNSYVKEAQSNSSTGLKDQIEKNLVPEITTIDNTWTQLAEPAITYSNLEFNEANKAGYVVAIALVSNADQKVYVHRGIYEVTSATSLSTSYSTTTNTTTTETTTTEEVKAEENPNTGISDYAIYLVPLALIGGVVLMMRKSYA